MARHPARNRALAGAFLLLMAAAAVAILVLVGGWEIWFTPHQTIRIHFDAAPNIKKGSPVLLAGHPVGRVQDIDPKLVPCPTERAREGMCYVAEVTAELPKRYAVHQNALVTIQQALVGQSAMINIVDVGHGELATKPLTGHQTSPFADAATQLGIGDAEKKNVSAILENLRDATQRIREDLPDIIAKLKTTGTNLAEVSEKAKGTLKRVDGILDENRANLKEAVANTRDLTADAKKKVGETLENLKAASAKINAVLDENRGPLKETVANARDLSAGGKAFVKKVDTAGEPGDDRPEPQEDERAPAGTVEGGQAGAVAALRQARQGGGRVAEPVRRRPRLRHGRHRPRKRLRHPPGHAGSQGQGRGRRPGNAQGHGRKPQAHLRKIPEGRGGDPERVRANTEIECQMFNDQCQRTAARYGGTPPRRLQSSGRATSLREAEIWHLTFIVPV